MEPTRTAPAVWWVAAKLYIYTKAVIYGCYALGYMLSAQLASDKWLFTYARRRTPPKCLRDPALGQHGYLTVNGLRFHYVEKGDRSKPLMLFVHGFPEFWYTWRHQLKEFSDDYWAVAVDMRGFGETDKPANKYDYSIPVILEDIKGIVTELGRDKFTLVGHDLGAVVTWQFVNKYPEMVDKYVALCAPSIKVFVQLLISFSSDQASKSWYTFFFHLPYLAEMYLSFGDFSLLRGLLLGGKQSSPHITDEDLEAYKYTFSQPGALTPPLQWYRAAFSTIARQGLFPKDLDVRNTAVPRPRGLLLLSREDIAICPKSAVMLQTTIENLEAVVLDDATHFMNQDRPAVVNKAVRAFLQ